MSSWEYSGHPLRATVKRKCKKLLNRCLKDPAEARALILDTRPAHREMFERVAPKSFKHYAGNYRGAPLPGLKGYDVTVDGDADVGYHHSKVAAAMSQLSRDLAFTVDELQASARNPEVSPERRVIGAVDAACNYFVEFLTIHPYANGNGHVGRLLVWLLFAQAGLPLKLSRWPVDPRPNVPGYDAMIAAYRRGDEKRLKRFFYHSLDLP